MEEIHIQERGRAMNYRHLFLSILLVLTIEGPAGLSALGGGAAGLSPKTVDLIRSVRVATAKYQDVRTARAAGYGEFLDCFTYGGQRGMGQHYVQGDWAGDDVLDPLRPEALVYEPLGDGKQVLVAYEYLVFADVWDPDEEGRNPPRLFGQEFTLKTTIPQTPPVWTLHIWLWSHNPDGLFADYNPLITCPADQPVVDMAAS